jgi:hypothetical protein
MHSPAGDFRVRGRKLGADRSEKKQVYFLVLLKSDRSLKEIKRELVDYVGRGELLTYLEKIKSSTSDIRILDRVNRLIRNARPREPLFPALAIVRTVPSRARRRRVVMPSPSLPALVCTPETVIGDVLCGRVNCNKDGLPNVVSSIEMLIAACQRDLSAVRALPKPAVRTFEGLLEHNFCLGESHKDIVPKKLIIQIMPTLARKGYRYIFLEHVYHDMQEDLDRFHASGEMSERLGSHLRDVSVGHMCTFTDELPDSNYLSLIDAARRSGVRVIALDAQLAYKGRSCKSGKARRIVFNAIAKRVMEHTLRSDPTAKWFAFLGNSHVNLCTDVIGLSEIFGCPDFFVFDKKYSSASRVRVESPVRKLVGDTELACMLALEAHPELDRLDSFC